MPQPPSATIVFTLPYVYIPNFVSWYVAYACIC